MQLVRIPQAASTAGQ